MGSGFGMDVHRSAKNNSRRHTRKSSFNGRGSDTKNVKLNFSEKGKMSTKELKTLGLEFKRQDNQRIMRNVLITILITAVLIGLLVILFITVE